MKLSEYYKLIKDEEVARRYFVVNTFDGAMTILGIILAFYISGNRNDAVVITSAVGASIAIAISGIWGAYAIERAERMRSIQELERHLIRELDQTLIERKVNIVTIMVALVDGLSPLVTAMIIISPFLASRAGLVDVESAFFLSIGLVALTLFGLGVIVARIAREELIQSGVKMLFAGVLVSVVTLILDYAKII